MYRYGRILFFLLLIGGCNTERRVFNILFIAVDDLRPELGCYGIKHVRSPNIDKLASEGIVFNKAYCSVSWCAPSRTSLLTGMRPSTTGVLDLKTHFREKLPDAITLPQYFKDRGYISLGFGKLYHNDPHMQDDPSWTEPCWIPPGPAPIQAYAGEENKRIAMNSPGYKSTATERADVPDNAYPDGQVTEQALQFIQELGSNEIPFFLGVGYYKPHLPFTAPEKYWASYDNVEIPLTSKHTPPVDGSKYMFRSWSEPGSYIDIDQEEPYSDSLSRHLKHGYLACVSFIDAQIGLLLDELARLGLEDNTIVVVWGDHGWKLGEYGRWSKHSNMEIDTRIPLIIKIPGEQPEMNDNIVETIDIYPTLLNLAGFEIPAELEGENMFCKKRDYALSEIPRDSVNGYSARTKHFRYIEWKNQKHEVIDRELYNYKQNDLENKNLAAYPEYQSTIDSLRHLLK
jgi:arylsulfatase A-like enzyme